MNPLLSKSWFEERAIRNIQAFLGRKYIETDRLLHVASAVTLSQVRWLLGMTRHTRAPGRIGELFQIKCKNKKKKNSEISQKHKSNWASYN